MKVRRLVHSPEHVLIELVPAGLGRRFAAFLLDTAVIVGAMGLISRAGAFLPEAVRAMFVATAHTEKQIASTVAAVKGALEAAFAEP